MEQQFEIIGKVIPTNEGSWNNQRDYDVLSLVTKDNSIYISNKKVPIGIDITDDNYWIFLINGGTAVIKIANNTQIGGIIAEEKTDEYKDEVRIDPSTGKLYTKPSATKLNIASNTNLGGIKANNKTSEYSQEVKIDPATGLLYIKPFELNKASSTILGGIKAEQKTSKDTVEVKIDSSTGKLYVEPIGEGSVTYNFTNTPDNEDLIEETKDNEEKVIKLADKEYDAARFSGFGRIYLRKNISSLNNLLTQDLINKINTRYIIQYDYDLGGETINIPENCILDFQGGSFKNGTIVGNGTVIISENTIFGTAISFSGTFNMNSVNAVWFGIKSGLDNIVPYFNIMLNFCIKTNIKNINMPSGTFNVKEPLIIGNGEREGWFITIKGAGASEGLGTFFKIYDGAYIKIDQKNDNYGALRSGGIFDCGFQSASRGTNKCLIITSGNAYSIARCHFSLFDTAISLTGSTYFTKISQCLFEICNNGVVSLSSGDENYQEGGANNNIIEGCWFTYCSNNPIKTAGESQMWHIYDCDFEGSNGTIELSSSHTISNCRIERNDINTPDLILGTGNIIDVKFYYAGGAPTAWKIIVNGNYNKITANFGGFIPYALVSYGVRNEFNITCNKTNYNYELITPLFLFDSEDIFILNGYSNKDKVYAQNILKYSDFTVSEDILAKYNDIDCRKLTKTNTNVSVSEEAKCTEMYISGKIYLKPKEESETVELRLLKHYISIKNVDKWFTFMQCINLIDSLAYNSKDYRLYDLIDTVDVSIIELVFSKKPLFSKPSWWLSHGDNYDNLEDDGTVINSKEGYYSNKYYIDRCYINYYMFCGIYTKRIVYKNILGKKYTYLGEDTFAEYPNNRKILKSIPYTAGAVQDQTNCKVEVIDLLNNKSVAIYCIKDAETSSYKIYPINSNGLEVTEINSNGTLNVPSLSKKFCVWITEMRKGDIVFNDYYNKMIMWNGESWVNLDGTTLE